MTNRVLLEHNNIITAIIANSHKCIS